MKSKLKNVTNKFKQMKSHVAKSRITKKSSHWFKNQWPKSSVTRPNIIKFWQSWENQGPP